jgi:hypothetical protein
VVAQSSLEEFLRERDDGLKLGVAVYPLMSMKSEVVAHG